MVQQTLKLRHGAVALATCIIPVLRRCAAFAVVAIRRLLRAVKTVVRFLYRCLRHLVVWAIDWVAWANEPARPKKVQTVPGLEFEVTMVAFLVVVGVLNLFV